MKKQFNKGFYLTSLGIALIICAVQIGCNKLVSNEEPIPKNNAPVLLHSSETIDVRVTDVITKADSLKRKVEILDKKNNTIYSTFIISLNSDNFNSNIYTQLKNKTFSGSLVIESDNEILYKSNTKNGKTIVLISRETQGKIKSNFIPTCRVSLIHSCVVQKISDMSIFDYGMCLAFAPECYGGLWASCSWSYCVNGQIK